MKTTNEIRRRVMKMAHVRRRADKIIFGEAQDDFAGYLRSSWATVKAEQAQKEENVRPTNKQEVLPSKAEATASLEAGLLNYYGVDGRYYGD